MKRKIVHIYEEKCNGCGLCVVACHEGAIELVNGIAKLVSDIYCDGLGDCLPNCPTGAIEIIEREAEDFDEAAVERRTVELKQLAESETAQAGHASNAAAAAASVTHQVHGHSHGMGGCPGSMAARIDRSAASGSRTAPAPSPAAEERRPSELQQWPVQISLVNPAAAFFENANLLVAADCTAFAYGDFHKDFIKDHITVIGCPKLDDNAYYAEKLAEILRKNTIKSITVVRMAVPCCGGIVQSVKKAMLSSETIVPYREVIVGIDGNLVAQ